MWLAARTGHKRRLPPSPEADIVDPDVDLSDPAQRAEIRPHLWDVLAAVAAGGVVGAEGRYGIGVAMPHGSKAFPWGTLITNVTGCLLIGVLMVVVVELSSPHRLVRPFLGTGVLGGYTTFSTFAVDTDRLLREHRPLLAVSYGVTTVVLCLAAVSVATVITRRVGRLLARRAAVGRVSSVVS